MTTATLLLHLAGPLQSWGTQTSTSDRPTALEPTKSGVVGLCAAALGIKRGEPIDHLAALTMGVRVDREGALERDFQTVHPHPYIGEKHLSAKVNQAGAQGRTGVPGAKLRDTYYLADAVFVVALTGNAALIHEIAAALTCPVFPLSLGRVGHPPARPPLLGVTTHTSPLAALHEVPWQAARNGEDEGLLRTVVEREGNAVAADVPTSAQAPRAWGARQVGTLYVDAATLPAHGMVPSSCPRSRKSTG